VVSKEDVGPGTLLFVMVMDEQCMYNNKKNDSISATIVHCISEVPEGDLMKKELQRFLHQVLKENKSQFVSVSGLCDNDFVGRSPSVPVGLDRIPTRQSADHS
jgi:hypothetical protein